MRRQEASLGRIDFWSWSLLAVGACLLLYAALVLVLVIAGRREGARPLAGFIPDCVVLCSRLLGDARVLRRKKALLVALTGYLALPFDLVPDFIPRTRSLSSSSAMSTRRCSCAASSLEP